MKTEFRFLQRLGLLLLSILSMATSWGQPVLTKGTDFWVAFIPCGQAGHEWQSYQLSSATPGTNKITVTNPQTEWSLQGLNYMAIPPEQCHNNVEPIAAIGLHVTADTPIDLYASASDSQHSDMTLVFPTAMLGTEYYIQTPQVPYGISDSNACTTDFVVLATEDNTEVTVTLRQVANNYTYYPGTHHITLQRGQVATFQTEGPAVLHLSHTVSANKKVAVFAGNMRTVTDTNADGPTGHAYAQLPSTCMAADVFAVIPAQGQSDYICITPLENGTWVSMTNNSSGEDALSHWMSTAGFPLYMEIDEPGILFADKPVMVSQYHKSRRTDNNAPMSDWGSVAFTPLLSADYGSRQSSIVPLPMQARQDAGNGHAVYYANVATRTADTALLTVNGNAIQGFTPIEQTEYSYIRIPCSTTTHIASTAIYGFVGTHYGLEENSDGYYALLSSMAEYCHSGGLDTVYTVLAGCDSLIVAGQTIRTTGQHKVVDLSHGVGTIYFVDATINQSYYTEVDEQVDDTSFTWNGLDFSESTDTSITMSTVDGCDSIVRLKLNIISPALVWVPNIFTPNKETNNHFAIRCKRVKTMVVQIFDRWGTRVSQFDGLTEDRDGTCNGTPCKQGSYVYMIRYKGSEMPDAWQTKTGTVTLVR